MKKRITAPGQQLDRGTEVDPEVMGARMWDKRVLWGAGCMCLCTCMQQLTPDQLVSGQKRRDGSVDASEVAGRAVAIGSTGDEDVEEMLLAGRACRVGSVHVSTCMFGGAAT